MQSQEVVSVRESQITRLQSTVDRMLRERHTSLKTHLTEKKQLTEEKVSGPSCVLAGMCESLQLCLIEVLKTCCWSV